MITEPDASPQGHHILNSTPHATLFPTEHCSLSLSCVCVCVCVCRNWDTQLAFEEIRNPVCHALRSEIVWVGRSRWDGAKPLPKRHALVHLHAKSAYRRVQWMTIQQHSLLCYVQTALQASQQIRHRILVLQPLATTINPYPANVENMVSS